MPWVPPAKPLGLPTLGMVKLEVFINMYSHAGTAMVIQRFTSKGNKTFFVQSKDQVKVFDKETVGGVMECQITFSARGHVVVVIEVFPSQVALDLAVKTNKNRQNNIDD